MVYRTAEDIIAEAKSIVSRVARVDESEMGEHVLFRDELGIDSLMGMEIIASCEKRFDITIDEAALGRIERVGEFFELLIAACRTHRSSQRP